MKTGGRLPWSKIHEYLLAVGSCSSLDQFSATATQELSRLIPFDSFAGFMRVGDLWCIYGLGGTDRAVASYNSYYRTRQPAVLATDREHVDPAFLQAHQVVDWRTLSKFEYASDFMLPHGMVKTITHAQAAQAVGLCAHRSRLSPDYTVTEVAIVQVINQYLNIYWSLLTRIDRAEARSLPTQEEMRERFSALSSREAEVCSLIARRLSTAEIAAALFVSPRTVEYHVASIFDKLDVRSRAQLRQRVGTQR